MAAASARSWIQMVVFAGTLTVTRYTGTDMEYPLLGLMSIEEFAHCPIDPSQQMRCPAPTALETEHRSGGEAMSRKVQSSSEETATSFIEVAIRLWALALLLYWSL